MTNFSMPDNSESNSQSSMCAQNPMNAKGFKSRRKTSMFFKKTARQDESSKDETIKRLEEEKRKLKQELNKAYSRIRELELLTTRPSPSMPIQESPSTSELLYTSESAENRDDDIEVIDDESTSFSVEIVTSTRGSTEQGEVLDIENEICSTTPSAATIPTGNNEKSYTQRRQDQLRLKVRLGGRSISSMSVGGPSSRSSMSVGDPSSRSRSGSSRSSRSNGREAHLDYFSRQNSPPLERIIEIQKRPNHCDDEDTNSTTSELTASVASSTMLAAERRMSSSSGSSSSRMVGRNIPVPQMESLLRISSESTRGVESDTISYIDDDESGLFGERYLI